MEPISPPRGTRLPAPPSSARPPLPRSHTFLCHDGLWQDLEHAAREQGRQVDHLIEEALVQYLQAHPSRPRIPALPPTAPASLARPPSLPGARPASTPLPLPSLQRPGPRPTQTTLLQAVPPLPAPPQPPPPGRPTPAHAVTPLPTGTTPPGAWPAVASTGTTPPGAWPAASSAPLAPLPGRPTPLTPPPLPVRPLTAPTLAARPAPPPPLPTAPAPAREPRLVIVHNGQRHAMQGDRFSIGRRKQPGGLSIKNPNVSGNHAVVEKINGVHYLTDLGSTNRTLVNGVVIERHAIREGDVALLAEEELRFTFEP